MGIAEQQIKEYAAGTGIRVEIGDSVWAVRMPSLINMAIFGPMANLFDMQYHIMSVEMNGILVIGVDGAGRLTPLHIWIPREAVQEVKIKKGMIAYEIQIGTVNGMLKYRVNKTMVGSNFHKKNVANVIQRLEIMKKGV